jgi:hypothetical protein
MTLNENLVKLPRGENKVCFLFSNLHKNSVRILKQVAANAVFVRKSPRSAATAISATLQNNV